MASEIVWELEPHTKAKHELLRGYLGAWFPILASSGWNRRVLFLDGFAGPGVYSNGAPGSPVIALDALIKHTAFSKLGETEFQFWFIEQDEARYTSLEQVVDEYWRALPGGRPANVHVHLLHTEFATVATDLATSMREQKKQLAPTFAFIDPFGWKGVPLKVIADFLSFDKCEVLFNFMVDSVNRFVDDDRPGIARHFTELFGGGEEEHRAAARLSGAERKRFLRDLYIQRLREVGGFEHVRSFEMVDVDRGRTAYYLMFGTRHPKGLDVMKQAMWKVDPVQGAKFAGLAGDQEVLFSPEPNFDPLKTALVERFDGESATVERIEEFVITDTDYTTSHYKRVLKELETDGKIECLSERNRRGTYPAGIVLSFAAKERPAI